MLLRCDGHEVRALYRAAEVQQAVEQFEPQVVLIDIGLPDVDGYQVARQIRASGSCTKTRLVALTGYNQPEDEMPFMRLACQTRASGNVTLVIPPWNAVFGKKVYNNVEEVELEPATTSAKVLRETIATAASGK